MTEYRDMLLKGLIKIVRKSRSEKLTGIISHTKPFVVCRDTFQQMEYRRLNCN
jgi:hypothetical protein